MDVKTLRFPQRGGFSGASANLDWPCTLDCMSSRSASHRSVCMMINFREMEMGMLGILGGFWASHGVEINAGFESNLG